MTIEAVTPYDSENTITPMEIIDLLKNDATPIQCLHPRGPIFDDNIQYGSMYGTDYYNLLFELSQESPVRLLAVIQRGYHSYMNLPPSFSASGIIEYNDLDVKGIADAIPTLSLSRREEVYVKLSSVDPADRTKLSKALTAYDRANKRAYIRGVREISMATRKPYGQVGEDIVHTLMRGIEAKWTAAGMRYTTSHEPKKF